MMVRNEADIIEASVRHNLAVLDGLYVAHHRSVDGTGAILAALRHEGLPLAVGEETAAAFVQWRTLTALAHAAVRDGADFVFALDADEFLRAPSRPTLEAALAEVPAGMHAAVHWHTYVPTIPGRAAAVATAGEVRRRLAQERMPRHKVIAARVLLERPQEVIADGNHNVVDRNDQSRAPRHAVLRRDVATLAHLPVRSGEQIAAKAVVGWLAHCAAHRDVPDMAYHWRDLYEEICAGKAIDGRRVAEIAVNYGLPRDMWQRPEEVPLVDEPPLSDLPLRYRELATLDALAIVVRFTEDLARKHTADPAASASG